MRSLKNKPNYDLMAMGRGGLVSPWSYDWRKGEGSVPLAWSGVVASIRHTGCMIIAGYDRVSDYMYNPKVNIIHATHSSNRGRMISSSSIRLYS